MQDNQLKRAIWRANTHVHRVCYAAYERFLGEDVQGLEEDSRQLDQRGLFQRIKSRNIEDTQKISSQYTHDEEGRMLRDSRLVLGRWLRLFGTLLNTKSDKLRLDIIEGLLQLPDKYTLGVEPTKNEAIAAPRSMTNTKTVVPDELAIELLKLGRNHDPTLLREFHRIINLVWRQRCGSFRRRDAAANVLHKTNA